MSLKGASPVCSLHAAGAAYTAPVLAPALEPRLVSGFLSKCICGEFIIHNTALNLLLPGKLYFKLGKSHNLGRVQPSHSIDTGLSSGEGSGVPTPCVFVCVLVVACTQSVT